MVAGTILVLLLHRTAKMGQVDCEVDEASEANRDLCTSPERSWRSMLRAHCSIFS